jgi:hypothetical protein
LSNASAPAKSGSKLVIFAAGKACGGTWAKLMAEYDDLERIAEFYQSEDDPEDLLSALRSLIDPQREMDRNDWSAFWEKWGTGATSAAFARGFIEGAVEGVRRG